MSRTRKGGKPHPNYEFSSRRPLNGGLWGGFGKAFKKMTHKIERARNKRDEYRERE